MSRIDTAYPQKSKLYKVMISNMLHQLFVDSNIMASDANPHNLSRRIDSFSYSYQEKTSLVCSAKPKVMLCLTV